MTFQQYNVYDGLTACRLVAIANQSGTYFNGQLNNGVGATFTYATGALTIDSVVVLQGDSVALTNQTNAWENGIYVCTQEGAVGVSAVLTRRQDMQCIEQLKVGQWTTIGAGTAGAGSMFVVIEPLPAIFGVDNLSLQAAFPAGSGTASTKAASNNGLPVLASVSGAPEIANHIAVFADTAGSITDDASTAINGGNIQAGLSGTAGTLRSFPSGALSGVLILAAATNASGNFNTTISNATAVGQTQVISIPDSGGAASSFVLTNSGGTQTIATGSLALSVGTLTLGSSGNASSLTLFPGTAGNGTLIINPVNAGGAFNTTISNGTMGQSSVMTIPDPGNAAARFLVGATATPFVSGEFPVASGVAGLMVSSGVAASNLQNKTNIKAARTADIGGGGAGPLSVVVAGMTAASIIVGDIQSSSNPVTIQKITATGTGFDILFSGDPGASCFVNYVTLLVAQ